MKTADFRDTGIPALGALPWGSHACHFYQTQEDLLEVSVPYFKAGLEQNEFCFWGILKPFSRAQAMSALREAIPNLDRHLAAGALEIVPHDQWLLRDGIFDPDRAIDGWKRKLEEALEQGFAGMRIHGDQAWLTESHRKHFLEFEKRLDEMLAGRRMIALCTYPLDATKGSEIFDVAHTHQFTIAKRCGEFEVLETPHLKVTKSELVELTHGLDEQVREQTQRLYLVIEKLRKEIAEHRLAEALLEGQKNVLETMAAGAPLTETLDALVRLVEGHIPGMLGSILLADERGIHLRHGAAPSLPPEYVKAIDGLTIGPKVASCGTAAYCKEAVMVEDIATDPRWENFRAVALPHGLRACWSMPIFDVQGSVLGTFAMYYRHPALSDPEHLRLIEMATHIASLAICRNRVQGVLRESEARLKEAQQLASIGYWERDIAADRMTWSDETYRIFGLQSSVCSLSQAELENLIHPDDRHIQPRALAETLQSHQPYDVEYRIIRPDGELRFVHVRDAIDYDDAGRPTRIFGTVQDITERKRGEQALRQSKELLDLVLATLPVGVVVTNQRGDIVLINAASKQIWGDTIMAGRDRWAQTKGYSHHSGQRIGPDEWASVRALSDGQTTLNELIDIVTYDGREKTIQNSAAPIRNAEGLIVGAVVVNEDVTERVRAEELLQARGEEIRAIVENSPDLIVRFDRNLRRTYVNSAFIKAHGLPKEKLLGREIGSAAKDRIVEATTEEIATLEKSLTWVRDNRRPLDFESPWPVTAGRRDFAVRMEPEFDARGGLTSILVVSRDITELKANEAKLRQVEVELARVSRLTIMGELSVAIAHEINQPLASLSTNAGAALHWLAADPPNLDEARRAIQGVVRDGNWAGEVIARIRLLLKNREPLRTSVDLNEVIQESLTLLQPELTRCKISLETVLDAESPRVQADHVQLQQVLLNLVNNAVDSLCEVGDRSRRLCIQTNREGSGKVRVAVQDTGVGIDPAQGDQLFEPFFTKKPNGLGMGLAICRSIVESHGGRLWATSNDGPGVTFQFTLPVETGDST